MRSFNLHPLTLALLSSCTTNIFANITVKNQIPQHLSTIVVSASGFEQSVKKAPASISVITKEDIEKKNATTIADLLVDVPGVDVRNGIGKTSGLNVSIRGMKPESTLILINGRRQTTSIDVTPNGFGEVATGFMPPLSSIERIEVIRGPMSTLYGSDAMGGIINIITKKVMPEWKSNITISANAMENRQEADSWKTSFMVNGPLIDDQLNLELRGSYYGRNHSTRVDGSTDLDPRPNKAYIYDGGGKLTYKINEKNAIWLDAFHASQTYKNEDDRLGTTDTRTNAKGFKDELGFNRNQYAIGHDGDYDFGTWNTYISQIETETQGRTIPASALIGGNKNPLAGADRTLKNTDFIANSHIITTLEHHKVTMGAEYKNLTIQDNIVENGTHKLSKRSWSAYAEDEWNIFDNVAFTYGTRYESHSGFGGTFSPRAYLVWSATDILTIKGGVSTGYKAPSPKELYVGLINFGGNGTIPTLGNPELKPEKSVNYEWGFSLQPTDQIDFTATIFHNAIQDAIVSTRTRCSSSSACLSAYPNVTEETLFNQKFNAAKAKVNGLETSLQYEIIPEWEIKAAYTYTKSEITQGKNKGGYYNNLPRNAFNLTSTWHINNDLDLWLQHEYKSSRARFSNKPVAPTSRLGSSDYEEYKIFGDKLAGYNLFNLGASYSMTDHLRFNIAVNNLLDKNFTKDNQTYQYLDASGRVHEATAYKYIDIGTKTIGTYLPGRNYWLSVSYDF